MRKLINNLPLTRLIRIGIVSFSLFALQSNPHAQAQATQEQIKSLAPAMPSYMVVACNDGDTCRLKSADNTQIKVRLIGIDAPEHGKKRGKKKSEGQPGAEEAKAFLNSTIVGKTVTLRTYGSDMYGRNLAEIIIDNEPANLKMVKEGWAEVYKGKAPREFDVSIYQSAESEARKNKKGIWALPNYESPKEWRKKNKH